ncbi:MAG: NifB/NifX family molybdenum-iron cluster-binding protein [Vulcanibacillus sp.]
MKIAIASDGDLVSGHFGHCQEFTIYDIEGTNIEKKEMVQNPGHRPGALPIFLREKGVNLIIAGGMGSTAQDLFINNDIQVVVGSEGLCDEIIKEYLEGSLKSTGSICSEHQHIDDCGGH